MIWYVSFINEEFFFSLFLKLGVLLLPLLDLGRICMPFYGVNAFLGSKWACLHCCWSWHVPYWLWSETSALCFVVSFGSTPHAGSRCHDTVVAVTWLGGDGITPWTSVRFRLDVVSHVTSVTQLLWALQTRCLPCVGRVTSSLTLKERSSSNDVNVWRHGIWSAPHIGSHTEALSRCCHVIGRRFILVISFPG